ncbi:MAG TPA: hypothetical protein EYQ21_03580 [Flavobacteriales bacterium]|nr:hypothetical protein [Flavobacteriales bacterium]
MSKSTIEQIETQVSEMKKFLARQGYGKPTKAERVKAAATSAKNAVRDYGYRAAAKKAVSNVAKVKNIRVRNINPFYIK